MKNKKKGNGLIKKIVFGSSIGMVTMALIIIIPCLMILDFFGANITDDYVENNMDYEDPVSGTSVHLTKGYQHLTGDMSQQYLIFRNDDLGDIGRIQRQQKFAKALFEKMMSLETIPTLPTILDIWENNIDTNINILDISNLINLLDTLSTTEIKIKMLPGNLTPTGDWVPDNARVEQEINDMFPPVPEDAAEE